MQVRHIKIVSIIDSIIDVYYCVHYIMCIYISIAFFLIADSMTGIVSRNMLLIYWAGNLCKYLPRVQYIIGSHRMSINMTVIYIIKKWCLATQDYMSMTSQMKIQQQKNVLCRMHNFAGGSINHMFALFQALSCKTPRNYAVWQKKLLLQNLILRTKTKNNMILKQASKGFL